MTNDSHFFRRSSRRRPHGRAACALIAVIAATGVLGACSSSRDVAADPTAPVEATSTSADTGTTVDASTTTQAAATTTEAPTTTTEPPTTTTIPPTTTTIPPLVTEGARIIVANATNLQGGAGRLTGELAAVGYQMAEATNAAGSEEFRDTTVIYFLPAGEAVATSLSMVLGAPLARMPTPAPITDATAGLGEATVLIMLGRDLVGETPPGLAPYGG